MNEDGCGIKNRRKEEYWNIGKNRRDGKKGRNINKYM
jgi:hypothetical protein